MILAIEGISHSSLLPQNLANLCQTSEANASIIDDIIREERMCSALTDCGGGELYCRHVTVYDRDGNQVASYWCKGWS